MLRSRQQKWLHGFDAGLLLDQLAGDLGAHAGAGARAVGNVDAVDAVLRRSGGRLRFRARRPRRAAAESPRRRRTCRPPAWRRACDFSATGTGASAWDARLRLVHRDAELLLHGLQRARLGADQLDVVGRGAAAAADDLARRPTACGARTAPCIRASTDKYCGPPRAWAGRRWAWRSWACERTPSSARWFRAWPWDRPSNSAR